MNLFYVSIRRAFRNGDSPPGPSRTSQAGRPEPARHILPGLSLHVPDQSPNNHPFPGSLGFEGAPQYPAVIPDQWARNNPVTGAPETNLGCMQGAGRTVDPAKNNLSLAVGKASHASRETTFRILFDSVQWLGAQNAPASFPLSTTAVLSDATPAATTLSVCHPPGKNHDDAAGNLA